MILLTIIASLILALLIWIISKKFFKEKYELKMNLTNKTQILDNEENLKLRKQIDLHFGSKYYDTILYSEISFFAPFGEVFNLSESILGQKGLLKGNELIDLANSLNIKLDKDFLINQYLDDINKCVEVYHSESDEQVFMYFDLERDETDQIGMFFLGIRFKKTEDLVIQKTLEIYKRLQTSSKYSFDNYGTELYRKVFKSFSYFYNGIYDKLSPRQINHHDLNSKQNV
ncbi:MAG: hypothetical protein NTW54_06525 [Bacteroidetes bacterium]|nr:hypothetical protein [Bacteroidota bacterium]